MSKAAEWAKAAPKPHKIKSMNVEVRVLVNDDEGLVCEFDGAYMEPAEAVELGKWLIDTFGD